LKKACEFYAKDIIAHGARDVEKKDIFKFISQMTAISYYWSTLESQFHNVLGKFTLGHDSDDVRCLWLTTVRNTLQSAWNQQIAAVSTGNVWAIRALVKARKPIRDKLAELNEEIKKLTPEKEEP